MIFLVLVYIFVGVPFLITLTVFTGRFSTRRRERRRFLREQEEAIARFERERETEKAGGEPEKVAVEMHDALDLLAGRFVPVGLKVAPRKQEWVRMKGGLHHHDGGTTTGEVSPQID